GVGLGGAGFELALHGERHVEGERGDGGQQQLADRVVDAGAVDPGAEAVATLDAVALAEVLGDLLAAAGVIAHGHALAAPAAHDDALQQGGPFPGRAGPAVLAARLGALGEAGEVVLVIVPADV